MDDIEKQIIENSLDKASKRRLPVTKDEVADVVSKAEADSTRLTVNAITENTKTIEKLFNEKIEIDVVPKLTLPDKPLKTEITNEVVIKNLKELKIPEPKVNITTEKYEISQQEIDITPITKAIKEIPKAENTIGKGVEPGKNADPTRYTVVRLSSGKTFYDSVGGGGMGATSSAARIKVRDAGGNWQDVGYGAYASVPVQLSPGVTTAVSGNLSITSTSGIPTYTFQTNIPTIQTVNVQNAPNVQITPGITTAVSGSLSLTSTSGTPTYSYQTNIPTIQTVNVQNLPPISGTVTANQGTNPWVTSLTTTSGTPLFVAATNFPTTITVNQNQNPWLVQIPAPVTTAVSGIINNFPTTYPVTGTFWQTTQPVSIATMPTTPVTGTFWQATQPISAATLPLPTGASTSAKQPALGTAGTASTDVLTIQGIAGMTKLLVTPDAVALPANQSVNVSQINGVTPLMGNGITGTGSQRVTIASDNTAFPVNATLSAETTKVVGTVNIAAGQTVGLVAGIAEIGNVKNSGTFATQATQAGVWTVQPGNTANTTAWKVDGSAVTQPVSLASVPSHAVTNVGTFATQSTLVAATTGGATPYKLVSAATTNATSVKASVGTVYMITASNVNAAARYLKLYNKASAPTVGTDVPVFTFIIPGNTAGAGTNIPLPAMGVAFTTGIAFALTTGIADADTGAVAASEIAVNLAYS